MSAEARRLHPASLITGILQTIRSSILGLIPLAGSFAFSDRPFVSVPVLVAILAAIVLFPTLGWLRFRYTVGADALVIEQGVLGRTRRVIPFERVQDVNVSRGLVARATGTALVTVETGGAGKDEGRLDVVTLAEVHRLRAAIRAARGRLALADAPAPADGAQPAEPEPEPERLLYRMTLPRVVLSGVLGFSLLWLALAFAGLQWIDPFVEGTRFDLGDRVRDAVADWRDGDAADGRALLRLATLELAATALAAALLLGIVTGIVLALLRDHGFRLAATAGGFRVRRGLVTLKEVQIPRARVQQAVMKAPLLMRPFGLWRLEVGTLGAAGDRGGDHAVAPLVTPEEARPILADLGWPAAPPADAWRRGHGLLVLMRALPPAGVLAVVAAGVTLLVAPALLVLLFVVPVLLMSWLAWRGERHAVADGVLHVRSGIVTRRHVVVPLRRIQSVTLTRGPAERLLGLSGVLVDVAGGSAMHPVRVSGLVPDDARALAARLVAGRAERPVSGA